MTAGATLSILGLLIVLELDYTFSQLVYLELLILLR